VELTARINVDDEALARFCERHSVRRLALFGSVLRDDFDDASDVDMLFELEPGTRLGYFGLVGMERELSGLIGRPVDLRTTNGLSEYFRDRVVSEARPIYVRR
jgi:predicted nucleotidyltransferase